MVPQDSTFKRLRASVQKVRTGCRTCKVRRIKCDETKPHCQRCTSTGRRCDGYDPTFTRRHQTDPPSEEAIAQLGAATLIYSIPFKIPGSQQDRQLVHYFCVQGAPDLSGFSTSRFWTRVVLQQSQHEPLVRRALIALSSVHQEYTMKKPLDSDAPELGPVTLREYDKAVRQLRKYLSSTPTPSKRLILICCVLFYCFEGARGNYDGAMGHLHSGLGILQDWVAEERKKSPDSSLSQESSEDVNCLTEVFARMDLQASIFDDDRMPYLSLVSAEEVKGNIPCVPTRFTELREAQLHLDKLQSWLWRFLVSHLNFKKVPLQHIPREILQERTMLEIQMNGWSLALKCYMENNPARSEASEDCIKVLTILQQTMLILLRTSLPEASAEPTNYESDFENILCLAEPLLNRSIADRQRWFTFETSLIAPLYFLIARSRKSQLRSRAMALLSRSQRREGLMQAQTIVNVTERLIKLEEAAEVYNDEKPVKTFDCVRANFGEMTGGFNTLDKALSEIGNGDTSASTDRRHSL